MGAFPKLQLNSCELFRFIEDIYGHLKVIWTIWIRKVIELSKAVLLGDPVASLELKLILIKYVSVWDCRVLV